MTAPGPKKETLAEDLIKYRVLGRPSPSVVSIWRYGAFPSADGAIRRLKHLKSATKDSIHRLSDRGVVKANQFMYMPQDAKYVDYWIENEGLNNVTLELLTQFIHDPKNKGKKKMIEWAAEEVLRLRTSVTDTGWKTSEDGMKGSRMTRRAK